MTLWLRALTGTFGTWPVNLDEEPCSTIQAKGLGGRGHSQYEIINDGGQCLS